ncbi:MAG: multidrug efflux pump subunit AcrB, partial [Myxococcota bacterium]
MNGNPTRRGAIAWTARHPVVANLIMVALIGGGIVMSRNMKMEVFPEFQLDIVSISVIYPATSPAEVERGVVTAIEEAVDGLDGIKKVSSSALEGRASITVELVDGIDPNVALADIKNAVDRVRSLPKEAEDPIVSLASNRKQVISLVIYGDRSEHELRALAEQARADLLAMDEITQVELDGVRAPQIGVEVSQNDLRRYGLTLAKVAQGVRASAVEVAGGGVKTPSGEVLVRTAERRDFGSEFRNVPLVTTTDGTRLELGDVATRVDDGFADTDESASFNGKPAVVINVFRTGDETPIEVADAVKAYQKKLAANLPPGLEVDIWRDQSRVLRERIDLLMRNAAAGLALVLLVLGLFLEMRLAFWVTMGIPISFFGSLLLAPVFGISINMITLFAFIVTLGMVVDDAIVVGENVYFLRKEGKKPMEAAIIAAQQVAVPVTFAILTSIAAFSPMFFVPGFSGKIFFSIPAVVVSVLILSLFESLFVLPAHLGHLSNEKPRGVRAFIVRIQTGFANGLEWVIEKTYRPVVSVAVEFRYVTAAAAAGLLVLTIGFVAGGFIRFEFMPKIDSDTVGVSVRMPFGIAVEDTEAVRARLVATAKEALEELGGIDKAKGIYATVGSGPSGGGPGPSSGGSGGSHIAGVTVQLVASELREFSASQFVERWRALTGRIPNVENVAFTASLGGP